jgi:hypothetical protein
MASATSGTDTTSTTLGVFPSVHEKEMAIHILCAIAEPISCIKRCLKHYPSAIDDDSRRCRCRLSQERFTSYCWLMYVDFLWEIRKSTT